MNLITIGFTGDVMLGRTLDGVISDKGFNYPWGDVLPLMNNTDLNIINLETALTNSTKRVSKTFNFKATPDKIQALVNANVKIVNLANNHILDFDTDGLIETIATLDKVGIKHVGAGKDAAAAVDSVIEEVKNIRIGVIGCTDNEPDWKAHVKPGTNYISLTNKKDYKDFLGSVEKLKKETDIVIVSLHWGPNMQERPGSEFIHFAHTLIDHGANIIHGHSAHILQGIEYYKKNLILYDTGDFIDDYVVDPDLRNDLSAFFLLTISKAGIISCKLVPVRICQYQVNQAKGEDHEWVIRRMQQLSSDFNTQINEMGEVKVISFSHKVSV